MLSLMSQPLSTTWKLLRCDPERVNASEMGAVLGINSQKSRNASVRQKALDILCLQEVSVGRGEKIFIPQNFGPEHEEEPKLPTDYYDVLALGRFYEPIAKQYLIENLNWVKEWKQPSRICALPPLPMACSPDLMGTSVLQTTFVDSEAIFGVEIKVPSFRSIPKCKEEIYPEHLAQCYHSIFCCPGIYQWMLVYYSRFTPEESVYFWVAAKESEYEMLLLEWTRECFNFLENATTASHSISLELGNNYIRDQNPAKILAQMQEGNLVVFFLFLHQKVDQEP